MLLHKLTSKVHFIAMVKQDYNHNSIVSISLFPTNQVRRWELTFIEHMVRKPKPCVGDSGSLNPHSCATSLSHAPSFVWCATSQASCTTSLLWDATIPLEMPQPHSMHHISPLTWVKRGKRGCHMHACAKLRGGMHLPSLGFPPTHKMMPHAPIHFLLLIHKV